MKLPNKSNFPNTQSYCRAGQWSSLIWKPVVFVYVPCFIQGCINVSQNGTFEDGKENNSPLSYRAWSLRHEYLTESGTSSHFQVTILKVTRGGHVS